MNAGDIWSGSDYAWYPYIGHLKYHSGAKRVRVIRTKKRRDGYNSKATTYVDVWMIDENTEEAINENEIKEVRARDIFARWEDYAEERDRIRAEKKKQEEEYRQRVEERETARRAREAELIARRESVRSALEEKGIPRDAVTFTSYGIQITTAALEEWLGLNVVQS